MSAFAGQVADPGAYRDDIRKRVARGRRTTDSSTTTTTELPVLRIDGIVLKAGYLYHLHTSALLTISSIANDFVGVRFRYSSTETATISSTELHFTQHRRSAAANSEGIKMARDYVPSADETGSLLLTVVRISGTGNVQILGGAAYPIELYVDDCGVDPGDTGVLL